MDRQPVGIRFSLPNAAGKPVQAILTAIEVRPYCWEIRNDEICGWPDIGGVYRGEEVMRELPSTDYYCISIILKGFADDRVERIPDYPAMCKSSCEILMILDDVETCTLIFQDLSLCRKTWAALHACGYRDIRPLFAGDLPPHWNYT